MWKWANFAFVGNVGPLCCSSSNMPKHPCGPFLLRSPGHKASLWPLFVCFMLTYASQLHFDILGFEPCTVFMPWSRSSYLCLTPTISGLKISIQLHSIRLLASVIFSSMCCMVIHDRTAAGILCKHACMHVYMFMCSCHFLANCSHRQTWKRRCGWKPLTQWSAQ